MVIPTLVDALWGSAISEEGSGFPDSQVRLEDFSKILRFRS